MERRFVATGKELFPPNEQQLKLLMEALIFRGAKDDLVLAAYEFNQGSSEMFSYTEGSAAFSSFGSRGRRKAFP